MPHQGHLSRAHLRLRDARSRSSNITPSRGGCTRHHGGGRVGILLAPEGHAKCEATWRGWQSYHMGRGPRYGEQNGQGWVDIAYTAGYCQHGYTLAGRGLGIRTAANGTNAGNQSYYAFTFIGGGDEVPTADALDALDWLVVQARNGGAGSDFNAHSDHKPTSCPGDFLRNYTFGNRTGVTPEPSAPAVKPAPIRPEPKPAPSPAPTGGVIVSSSFPNLNRGDTGDRVKRLQGLLAAWGHSTYSGALPDGDFGPKTDAAALAVCKELGLVSKGYRGKISVGPKTMGRLVNG